ncbi:MAG: PD40 domain-containing protein [Planctomycetes bacterium]|nr:PD40 domain-containing protein [Planctomycetota bacterium]
MKKTITVVLVLALCLVTKVANADFTFGEPVNLGPPFNTPSREVSFVFSADGLEIYISSERSGGLGYIDMWRSTRENADNPWGLLVNVQEINSRYNEAFPCLSADGLTLYFSDWYNWNAAGDRPGGVGNHDLWMCTRASCNDPWGMPVNMGAPFNSGSPDMSPTISHDGLTFIFASKRSGGLGDFDLWMSTRRAVESDWAVPVNMGPAVNSVYYDCEVCLSTDGLAMFFCSNRSGGMGSYDMWLTTRQNQAAAWSPPINLGPVINTSGMEGAPSLSPDLKTLYFCSSKSGGIGGWDMYEVPIVPILDFNSDGIVNVEDIVIITEHWGENYALCDIGPMPWGDGIVDVHDLVVLTEYIEPIDQTLIAHWTLDETEGDIAQDSAGDNDAFVIGNPVWLPSGGQVDGALMLDGLDDSLVTGPIPNLVERPFSVFAWIIGGAPGQVIISQSGGANWFLADPTEGNLMTELKSPGRSAGPLQSQTNITDGYWHRIGLVWDGLYRTLYVDDIVVAQDTQNGLEGSDSGLYIGTGKAMEPGTYFSGLIDDVRIYNRVVIP